MQTLYPRLHQELIRQPLPSFTPSTINTLFTSYKISHLHLAVIQGDYKTAGSLLAQKANPNLRDYRGYTPMHHAALKGDLIMVEVLRICRGNDNLKTQFNGTVTDLLILNRTYPDSTPDLYEETAGNISKISLERFSEISEGAVLSKNMYVSSKTLAYLWEKQTHETLPTMMGRPEEAEDAYSCPYQLILKEIDLQGNKKTKGIFSHQTINTGKGVGIWVGEFLTDTPTYDNEYAMDNVCPKKYRGFMGMVNDGPPNLFGTTIRNFHGLPKVTLFSALRTIKKGEQLFINYQSNHQVKFGSHVELGWPSLTPFFKSQSLSDSIKLCSSLLGQASPDFYQAYHAFKQICYLLSTPTTLMEIISQGVIKYNDVLEILENPLFFDESLNSYLSCMSFLHLAKITRLKPELDRRDAKLLPHIMKELIDSYRYYGNKPQRLEMFTYFANAWTWFEYLNNSVKNMNTDLRQNIHSYLFKKITSRERDLIISQQVHKEFEHLKSVKLRESFKSFMSFD